MKKLLTGLIRFYQHALSPLKRRPCCKYYPTCSSYAIDAINEWGAFRGSILSARRILRCNPFSRGGIDYVPKRSEKPVRGRGSAASGEPPVSDLQPAPNH